MRALALIVIAGACGSRSSGDADSSVADNAHVDSSLADGGGDDANTDAAAPQCYGTGLDVRICLEQAPTTAFSVTGIRSIDTGSSSPDCLTSSGSKFCVIAATSITIDGTLRATGSRPLVLLSLSTITVNGLVDVSSHWGFDGWGAGNETANYQPCRLYDATGGAAGGSFATLGGAGASPVMTPGPGFVPTTLRKGCPGEASGEDNGGALGGGAVDLIAVSSVSVTGRINASGAGGGGGWGGGASGGGAGGMIVFDAPAVSFEASADIFANGGGGGGGAGTSEHGVTGESPTGFDSGGGGAAGGAGGGGSGGNGARFSLGAGDGHAGTNGGWGGSGGGGLGFVRVFQSPLPATGHVSPPPS